MPSACEMQKIQTLMPLHFPLETTLVSGSCSVTAPREHRVTSRLPWPWALPVPAQPPLGVSPQPSHGPEPHLSPCTNAAMGSWSQLGTAWALPSPLPSPRPCPAILGLCLILVSCTKPDPDSHPWGTSWPGLVLSPSPGSCWSCSQALARPPGNTHCLCHSQCPDTSAVQPSKHHHHRKTPFTISAKKEKSRKDLGWSLHKGLLWFLLYDFSPGAQDSPLKRLCLWETASVMVEYRGSWVRVKWNAVDITEESSCETQHGLNLSCSLHSVVLWFRGLTNGLQVWIFQKQPGITPRFK